MNDEKDPESGSSSLFTALSYQARLEASIRRLRKCLAYYADPVEGWAEIEHADAYEESRELVPFDAEEQEDEKLEKERETPR